MSVRLRAGVVTQVIDGQMLLLDSRGGQYFDLNASGTVMLQALLDGRPRSTLIDELEVRYQQARARLEQDLDQLLQALQRAGLVEINQPA